MWERIETKNTKELYKDKRTKKDRIKYGRVKNKRRRWKEIIKEDRKERENRKIRIQNEGLK